MESNRFCFFGKIILEKTDEVEKVEIVVVELEVGSVFIIWIWVM